MVAKQKKHLVFVLLFFFICSFHSWLFARGLQSCEVKIKDLEAENLSQKQPKCFYLSMNCTNNFCTCTSHFFIMAFLCLNSLGNIRFVFNLVVAKETVSWMMLMTGRGLTGGLHLSWRCLSLHQSESRTSIFFDWSRMNLQHQGVLKERKKWPLSPQQRLDFGISCHSERQTHLQCIHQWNSKKSSECQMGSKVHTIYPQGNFLFFH